MMGPHMLTDPFALFNSNRTDHWMLVDKDMISFDGTASHYAGAAPTMQQTMPGRTLLPACALSDYSARPWLFVPATGWNNCRAAVQQDWHLVQRLSIRIGQVPEGVGQLPEQPAAGHRGGGGGAHRVRKGAPLHAVPLGCQPAAGASPSLPSAVAQHVHLLFVWQSHRASCRAWHRADTMRRMAAQVLRGNNNNMQLVIPVPAIQLSLVRLELDADSLSLVVNASPGELSSITLCTFGRVDCSGTFEALAQVGYLYVVARNLGTLDSEYTVSVTTPSRPHATSAPVPASLCPLSLFWRLCALFCRSCHPSIHHPSINQLININK